MPPIIPPTPHPNSVMAMTVPAYAGICGCNSGGSSCCIATPTVRIRAYVSNPSNSQPRFDATSVFHCTRFSVRYQGTAEASSVAATTPEGFMGTGKAVYQADARARTRAREDGRFGILVAVNQRTQSDNRRFAMAQVLTGQKVAALVANGFEQ